MERVQGRLLRMMCEALFERPRGGAFLGAVSADGKDFALRRLSPRWAAAAQRGLYAVTSISTLASIISRASTVERAGRCEPKHSM